VTRDTCRYPSCDREPGSADDNAVAYSTRRFCSLKHAVKFDHLKADARDAERDAEPDPKPAPGQRP
jgi:hypothetical protein